MFKVLLFLAFFGIITIAYDVYFVRTWKRYKRLATEGKHASAVIIETGTTTGAIAVTSSYCVYRFEPTPGQVQTGRVVMTGGISYPSKDDTVDIVYLPDSPKTSEVVGNNGRMRTLWGPLFPLNLFFLLLLVAPFL